MTGGIARYLLILVLLAAGLWSTARLGGEWDLSASARHSLSDTSRSVLDRLEGPVSLTAFVPDDPELRRALSELVNRYRQHYPDISLQILDAKQEAEEVRRLDIPASGAVEVSYGGGTELLLRLSETTLTSALQRLLVRGEHWIVAVKGHGERRLDGAANHDLRDFGEALQREGFRIHNVDLPAAASIPANTALLVIADPRATFLLAEQALVADFLAGGGNLLWLADPGPTEAVDWLEQLLPVNRLPGSIVDALGARLGLEDPRFIPVNRYANHPVTARMQAIALFPDAAGLSVRAAGDDWTNEILMASSDASWNETGSVKGEVAREAEKGEIAGPITIGMALERGDQRIAVVGDSDFLSNAYLGNGGNLDLGLNLVRWLTQNDMLIDIPAPAAPDARIELPPRSVAILAILFLAAIPLGLVAAGFIIRFRRKRR